MKAQVIIIPVGDGGEELLPFPLSTVEASFGISDFLFKLGELAVDFITLNAPGAAEDIKGAYEQVTGDVHAVGNERIMFGMGGHIPALNLQASHATVFFHAWTDDDIKPSFGLVRPTSVIFDAGERRTTQGDLFHYEYRFVVPFAIIPAGRYLFAFGTGDSGTLQDAAIGYEVGMEIAPGPPQPTIDQHYASFGGPSGFLGQPLADEAPTFDGIGRARHYQGGSILWTPGRGPHETHGAIRDKWTSLDAERGLLSYPLTDELTTPNLAGRFNHFQWGSIYWTPTTGAHEVHGAIRAKWASLGWERSFLGFPTSDELDLPGGGRFNSFQGGAITWTAARGANAIHNPA
jgi:hypothetical protein